MSGTFAPSPDARNECSSLDVAEAAVVPTHLDVVLALSLTGIVVVLVDCFCDTASRYTHYAAATAVAVDGSRHPSFPSLVGRVVLPL